MPINEFLTRHTEIDRRTGRISAISGASVSSDIRLACGALNRQRTRAIYEASHELAPRESSAAHVWKESVAGRLEEWALPFVSLERLGVAVDREGFLSGIDLEPLPAGADDSEL